MQAAWRWAALAAVWLAVGAGACAGEDEKKHAAPAQKEEVSARELLEALASIAEKQAEAAKGRGAADEEARWTTEAARLRAHAKLVAKSNLTAREFALHQEQLAQSVRARAEEAGDATLVNQAKGAVAFWSDIRQQLEEAEKRDGPVAIRVRVPGGEPREDERRTEPAAGGSETPAGVRRDDQASGVVRKALDRADEGDEGARREVAARIDRLASRLQVLGVDAPANDIVAAARAAGSGDAAAPLADERHVLAAAYRADAARLVDEAQEAQKRGDGDGVKEFMDSAAEAREMAEFLVGR